MILGHPDFSVQPAGLPLSSDSLFMHFHQGRILLDDQSGELMLPTWTQVQSLLPKNFEPFELAHAGERLIVSASPYTHVSIAESDTLHYHDLNVFRTMPFDTAALITACRHLWSWYENNRFCGKCSAPLAPDQAERALRCPACGRLLFPTIAPAVIVAITCGERILLARNQRYHHYALIAGYVEVGETLEHALRREVKEEVGLDIHSIRYIGDQPWGVSGSHMFAFHAQADDKAPISIQQSELADARWFDKSELQPQQHAVSVAFEMMERFRTGTL